MGREKLGWFVGGHPGVSAATEQFGRLDANPEGGVWVVVPLGKDLVAELWVRWPHPDYVPSRPTEESPIWRSRKVWVAPPEHLRCLVADARRYPHGIAGVIVLDPPCIMYKARGGMDGQGRTMHNDRPQHVVNFRAALDVDGWQPPLLLLTENPAKSINTELVARAFCLNGFRFIAGDSFACWEVSIDQD